jgi:hypothetical protein
MDTLETLVMNMFRKKTIGEHILINQILVEVEKYPIFEGKLQDALLSLVERGYISEFNNGFILTQDGFDYLNK